MSTEKMDRRHFLKAVAVTAVAATATGAGAALIATNNADDTPPAITSSPAQTITTVVDNKEEVAALRGKLLTTETENIRLQAELDAALRRINMLNSSDGTNGSVIEGLNGELDAASSQIGILSGLVALYEQLEEVDFSDLLTNGLLTLDGFVDELTDDLPTISEGLAAGQAALQQFEDEIPGIEVARQWLGQQFIRLGGFYDSVIGRLQDVVENVGDFLQMLGDWFADVLRWLPFGRGESAAQVVESLTDLLGETAFTIANVNTQVAQPLDVWVGRDGGTSEVKLQANLVRPLRDRALQPAGLLLNKTTSMKNSYATQVADPARAGMSDQQALRTLIAQYRDTHKIDRKSAA